VITCSDAASRGDRIDQSGPAVRALLEKNGFAVDTVMIVPDEADEIANAIELACGDGARLVMTTGGTGLSPRDVTPEATVRVCDRLVPGISEAMRAASLKQTPMAALSRAVAGTRGSALVVNLPGSVKGATECLSAILPLIPHALEILTGARVESQPQPC
ncbi:MAG TPA: MogA/MoaB family molybdenum cofactor biosynthesis protein, partial [Thermoanaerobaculia bacterium]|nr:MogA/MoaB family molybdenum cofactor biosynthesis protein [Thermoanaerobaculia bacterium]